MCIFNDLNTALCNTLSPLNSWKVSETNINKGIIKNINAHTQSLGVLEGGYLCNYYDSRTKGHQTLLSNLRNNVNPYQSVTFAHVDMSIINNNDIFLIEAKKQPYGLGDENNFDFSQGSKTVLDCSLTCAHNFPDNVICKHGGFNHLYGIHEGKLYTDICRLLECKSKISTKLKIRLFTLIYIHKSIGHNGFLKNLANSIILMKGVADATGFIITRRRSNYLDAWATHEVSDIKYYYHQPSNKTIVNGSVLQSKSIQAFGNYNNYSVVLLEIV